MRMNSMNPDICYYSFRFVFFWNESARVIWSEASGIRFISRLLSSVLCLLATNYELLATSYPPSPVFRPRS